MLTHYQPKSQIIEVKGPVRFYWDNEGYDGFEFGPLDNCTKYQLRLLDNIIAQLFIGQESTHLIHFIRVHFPKYWAELYTAYQAERDKGEIPDAFLEAVNEKEVE